MPEEVEPMGIVRDRWSNLRGQRVSARDRLYLAAEVPTLIVWGDRDRIPGCDDSRGRDWLHVNNPDPTPIHIVLLDCDCGSGRSRRKRKSVIGDNWGAGYRCARNEERRIPVFDGVHVKRGASD